MNNISEDINQYLHETFRREPRERRPKVKSVSNWLTALMVILLVGGGLLAFLITATANNAWWLLLALPFIVLGVLVGHFGDWYDRKHGI